MTVALHIVAAFLLLGIAMWVFTRRSRAEQTSGVRKWDESVNYRRWTTIGSFGDIATRERYIERVRYAYIATAMVFVAAAVILLATA